jgi:hypothetical protein
LWQAAGSGQGLVAVRDAASFSFADILQDGYGRPAAA